MNRAAFLRILSSVTVCATAATAGAQEQPTTAPSTPSAATTVTLAEQPYVDRSFGFSIRPFSDCTVVRHKRMDSEGDVELAQFVHPQRGWVTTVRLAHTTKPFTPDDLLAGLEEKLSEQYRGLKIERREKLKLAHRDAVRLAGTVPVAGTLWFRQQAAIFCKDNEFFVIVFNVPAADRTKGEELFDGMIRSFDILRSEMTQELLQKSLAQGAEWLRSVAKDRALGRNLMKEHYLRILLDGHDVGYLWLQESRTAVDRRDGVGIRHEGWLFDADGKVKRQVTQMFLSDDLTAERWETMVEVVSPPKGTAPAQRLVTLEQGVRDADKLLIGFSKAPNSTEMSDKVVEIPESYGPAAVFTLFPRAVDLSKPELYAFVSYNSERQGLVLRTLRVLEPQQNITIEGRTLRVTKIEDSEGLIPPISEIYVDDKGRLIRIVAGNLEMLATDLDKIKALYAGKVAATEQMVRPLAPSSDKAPAAKKAPGAKAGKPKGGNR